MEQKSTLLIDICADVHERARQPTAKELKLVQAASQACKFCCAKGTPVSVYAEFCLLFRCSNNQCELSSTGWGACIWCRGFHRKNFLSLAQWKRHVNNTHKKDKPRIVGSIPKLGKMKMVEPHPASALSPVNLEDSNVALLPDDDNNDCDRTADDIGCDTMADAPGIAEKMFGITSMEVARLRWNTCSEFGLDLGFPKGSRSSFYFKEAFLGFSEAAGLEYLVRRSHLKKNYADVKHMPGSSKASFKISNEQALLQIKIAELSFTLSPTDKERLVEVINGSYAMGYENGSEDSRTRFAQDISKFAKNSDLSADVLSERLGKNERWKLANQPTMITSVNSLRNFHLEGAHSIVRNLPYPEIVTNIKDHSYTPIIECIRHFLAHQQERRMATIPDTTHASIGRQVIRHTSMSPRAHEISRLLKGDRDEQALKGYLFFWSDDAEPNRMAKAGRGSVWILTMTIGTQPGDGHNFDNTYPIAIGRKGDDHDSIISAVEKEMKVLRSSKAPEFYIGSTRKMTRIQFSDMAHLADQPERRGFNYLRLGGGKYSARFGVSANHHDLYVKIRACNICGKENRRRLLEDDYLLKLPECNVCMNWDVLADGQLGLSAPPDAYPLLSSAETEADVRYENSPYCRLVRKYNKEGNHTSMVQMIKPFRITYPTLMGAVALAHDLYCNYGWSERNVTAYLQVEGLNDSFINRMLEHANRCVSHQVAREEANDPNCAEYYRVILKEAAASPEKYQRVPFPAAWTREGFNLSCHPDVIMHMLFLGIVDDVVQLTQNWLKATKRNAEFIRITAVRIEPLVKMDIKWINILRYTGEGFGHWVSENYLGFARVMRWFYQNMSDIAPEVLQLPPESTQRSWTKKQNELWLKQRGVDTTDKKALELRLKVAELMALEKPPEVIKEPQRRVDDVEELVTALSVLLECVMGTAVDEAIIMKTRYAVRVFLSAYEALYASVTGNSDGSIFTKHNIACLMNLPEAMERFGPLRQLWEGSTRGEGFLRFVKPLMTQGFKHQGNWHYHLLQNLSIAKAFGNIRPRKDKPAIPLLHESDSLVYWKSMFCKHKSVYTFRRDFEARDMILKKPISVVLIQNFDGSVSIVAVVDTYGKVVLISPCPSEPVRKFGINYYGFEVGGGIELVEWTVLAPQAKEIGYGLLLPLLEDGEAAHQKFALISSNWKSLCPKTTLQALVDCQSVSFD